MKITVTHQHIKLAIDDIGNNLVPFSNRCALAKALLPIFPRLEGVGSSTFDSDGIRYNFTPSLPPELYTMSPCLKLEDYATEYVFEFTPSYP